MLWRTNYTRKCQTGIFSTERTTMFCQTHVHILIIVAQTMKELL